MIIHKNMTRWLKYWQTTKSREETKRCIVCGNKMPRYKQKFCSDKCQINNYKLIKNNDGTTNKSSI